VPTWHDFRRNNEGDPGDDDEETTRQVGLEQDRCPASDQLDLEFKEDCEQSSLLSKKPMYVCMAHSEFEFHG
jgi:hypothetical protein